MPTHEGGSGRWKCSLLRQARDAAQRVRPAGDRLPRRTVLGRRKALVEATDLETNHIDDEVYERGVLTLQRFPHERGEVLQCGHGRGKCDGFATSVHGADGLKVGNHRPAFVKIVSKRPHLIEMIHDGGEIGGASVMEVGRRFGQAEQDRRIEVPIRSHIVAAAVDEAAVGAVATTAVAREQPRGRAGPRQRRRRELATCIH